MASADIAHLAQGTGVAERTGSFTGSFKNAVYKLRRSLDVSSPRKAASVSLANQMDVALEQAGKLPSATARLQFLAEHLVKSKLVSFAGVALVSTTGQGFVLAAAHGAGSEHFPVPLSQDVQRSGTDVGDVSTASDASTLQSQQRSVGSNGTGSLSCGRDTGGSSCSRDSGPVARRPFCFFGSQRAFRVAGSGWSVADVTTSALPWLYDCSSPTITALSSGGQQHPWEVVWLSRAGHKSLLSLPCTHEQRVCGVLLLGCPERAWEHAQLSKVGQVAHRITPYIAQAAADHASAMQPNLLKRYRCPSEVANGMLTELVCLDRILVGRLAAIAKQQQQQHQQQLQQALQLRQQQRLGARDQGSSGGRAAAPALSSAPLDAAGVRPYLATQQQQQQRVPPSVFAMRPPVSGTPPRAAAPTGAAQQSKGASASTHALLAAYGALPDGYQQRQQMEAALRTLQPQHAGAAGAAPSASPQATAARTSPAQRLGALAPPLPPSHGAARAPVVHTREPTTSCDGAAAAAAGPPPSSTSTLPSMSTLADMALPPPPPPPPPTVPSAAEEGVCAPAEAAGAQAAPASKQPPLTSLQQEHLRQLAAYDQRCQAAHAMQRPGLLPPPDNARAPHLGKETAPQLAGPAELSDDVAVSPDAAPCHAREDQAAETAREFLVWEQQQRPTTLALSSNAFGSLETAELQHVLVQGLTMRAAPVLLVDAGSSGNEEVPAALLEAGSSNAAPPTPTRHLDSSMSTIVVPGEGLGRADNLSEARSGLSIGSRMRHEDSLRFLGEHGMSSIMSTRDTFQHQQQHLTSGLFTHLLLEAQMSGAGGSNSNASNAHNASVVGASGTLVQLSGSTISQVPPSPLLQVQDAQRGSSSSSMFSGSSNVVFLTQRRASVDNSARMHQAAQCASASAARNANMTGGAGVHRHRRLSGVAASCSSSSSTSSSSSAAQGDASNFDSFLSMAASSSLYSSQGPARPGLSKSAGRGAPHGTPATCWGPLATRGEAGGGRPDSPALPGPSAGSGTGPVLVALVPSPSVGSHLRGPMHSGTTLPSLPEEDKDVVVSASGWI